MDLYDVMRTTFACREWTDDSVSDDTLHRILDNARFAPNGGNRQGQHVIVVKDKDVRRQLVPLGAGRALIFIWPRLPQAKHLGTRLIQHLLTSQRLRG